MQIKSQKDFFSGLMFMVLGVAFAWGAASYPVGNGARMGPGYFPLVLGVLLALIGAAITFTSLVVETVDGDRLGGFAWRALVCIVLANLVFGVALGGLPRIGLAPLGLVPGIYLLTLIASLASAGFRWKEVLVLGTVLSVLSYLLFILVFQLQLPVLPAGLAALSAH